MVDLADPISGWSIHTFLATKAGPAKQDTYGQLYHYLRRLFMDFHLYLHSKPVSFELHHVDARALNEALAERKFDRIEVSNIGDLYYLGISETLKTFGPFLRSPSANPHATLVTGFLNAVPEAKIHFGKMMPEVAFCAMVSQTRTALEYLESDLPPPTATPTRFRELFDICKIKMTCAVILLADMELYFDL